MADALKAVWEWAKSHPAKMGIAFFLAIVVLYFGTEILSFIF